MIYKDNSYITHTNDSWEICVAYISEWQDANSANGSIRFNNEFLLQLLQNANIGLFPIRIDENHAFVYNFPGWGCHRFSGTSDVAIILEESIDGPPKSLIELYKFILKSFESLYEYQESSRYAIDVKDISEWDKKICPINTTSLHSLIESIKRNEQQILSAFDCVKIQYHEHTESVFWATVTTKDYEYIANYQKGIGWVIESEKTEEADN